MQDEPYRLSPDPAHESAPTGHDGPMIYQLQSTQTDEELRVIQWILTLLGSLPYDTQVRAMTYIQERIQPDDTRHYVECEPGSAEAPATDGIAKALAESDGRNWETMSPLDQAPYHQHSQVLADMGVRILRWT